MRKTWTQPSYSCQPTQNLPAVMNIVRKVRMVPILQVVVHAEMRAAPDVTYHSLAPHTPALLTATASVVEHDRGAAVQSLHEHAVAR